MGEIKNKLILQIIMINDIRQSNLHLYICTIGDDEKKIQSILNRKILLQVI